MTYLLMSLDKMYKHEMDPTRTLGATERTRNAGRTDGRTDGWSETNIPPSNFVVGGGYNKHKPLGTHWTTVPDSVMTEW